MEFIPIAVLQRIKFCEYDQNNVKVKTFLALAVKIIQKNRYSCFATVKIMLKNVSSHYIWSLEIIVFNSTRICAAILIVITDL